jgi:16S rRNA (guanine966-N2)-methyltransferase
MVDNAPMGGKTHRAPRGGSVRIIGGRWRGRRVVVSDVAALRPTPDRVRETLFNWLAAALPGARCLDLYAGTGVLGLEALSRGASQAVFVECAGPVAAALESSLRELGAAGASVVQADAADYLRGPASAFDIVFLDPPYGTGLGNLCTLLDRGWLAQGARVYLESNRRDPSPELPVHWRLLREKTAGQVRFALAEVG